MRRVRRASTFYSEEVYVKQSSKMRRLTTEILRIVDIEPRRKDQQKCSKHLDMVSESIQYTTAGVFQFWTCETRQRGTESIDLLSRLKSELRNVFSIIRCQQVISVIIPNKKDLLS